MERGAISTADAKQQVDHRTPLCRVWRDAIVMAVPSPGRSPAGAPARDDASGFGKDPRPFAGEAHLQLEIGRTLRAVAALGTDRSEIELALDGAGLGGGRAGGAERVNSPSLRDLLCGGVEERPPALR